ncbi:hypothetical protein FA13DRAFT_1719038 [Coprinellus micaceus]|uniref:Uncharacterized protein n=1 Tax=Coprinellus micaceus TaxID=71717 RepID=A0A4Y7SC50_COPMI|nr:hypothetical protein FA13DRAFT_1719038 [Coprinellus micaceus]
MLPGGASPLTSSTSSPIPGIFGAVVVFPVESRIDLLELAAGMLKGIKRWVTWAVLLGEGPCKDREADGGRGRGRYCWGPTSSQPAVFALAQLSIPGVCPKLRELRMERIANVGDDPAEGMLVDFISGRRAAEGSCEGETGTRISHHAACVKQISKVKIMFADRERVDIRAELEGRGLDLDGFCLDLAYPC